jgi:hypothetical protein
VIHLSPSDAQFMMEKLDLSPSLREMLAALVAAGGEIDDDSADELRDLCGDRLQTHGFDANYVATAEGRRLESLVDRLFVG